MRNNRLIISAVNVLLLAGIVLLISHCAAPKSTTATQGGKYSEDLSVWRPKPKSPADATVVTPVEDRKTTAYVEPKLAVNKPLDTVLDSIDHINRHKRYVEGFTIQVYSGKREEALSAKKTLATSLPDLDCDVQFTEPIFRVKVGKYYTRLEAQHDYMAVKRYFPAAIIIPEKLSLN